MARVVEIQQGKVIVAVDFRTTDASSLGDDLLIEMPMEEAYELYNALAAL